MKIKRKFSINRQTWALHSAIADKLIANPKLIEKAENCLQQRYAQKLIPYGNYIVWTALLPLLTTRPELFKQELLAEDQKMEQLRRQTIFVGILTEQERQSVLGAIQEHQYT